MTSSRQSTAYQSYMGFISWEIDFGSCGELALILHVKYGGFGSTWSFDDFTTPFYHYSSLSFSTFVFCGLLVRGSYINIDYSFTLDICHSPYPIIIFLLLPNFYTSVLVLCPFIVLWLVYAQACRSLSLIHSRHSLRPFLVFLSIRFPTYCWGSLVSAVPPYAHLAYSTLHSHYIGYSKVILRLEFT